MKLTSTLKGSAAAVALAAGLAVGASAAWAQIPNKSGGVVAGNDLTIKFQNWETFINTAGVVLTPSNYGTGAGKAGIIATNDQNFGIFRISSVVNALATSSIWQAGNGTSGYLYGVFAGIKVTSANPVNGGVATNTGGVFQVYWDASNVFSNNGLAGYTNTGCGYNTLCYDGITDVGATLELTINLTEGADPSSSTDFLPVSFSGVGTNPPSGGALGYGNVVGGAAQAQFDTNGLTTSFGNTPDVLIADDWCAETIGVTKGCNGGVSGAPPNTNEFLLGSNDPITADAVPEPSALAVFGTGLLGLGWLGYRRRSRG